MDIRDIKEEEQWIKKRTAKTDRLEVMRRQILRDRLAQLRRQRKRREGVVAEAEELSRRLG